MAPLYFSWFVLVILSHLTVYAQIPETMEGPSSPSEWNSWYNKNLQYRKTERAKVNYNGSIYTVPQLFWVQNAFVIPMMFPFDLYFYDPINHQYTIDKWISFMNDLYGGVDAILYWSTYTNMGIDDRNQYEMYSSLPGGIKQLNNITNYLRNKYDIQILLAYNPWDTGTNYSGNPDYISLSQYIYDSGASGFFGDTMNYVPEIFYSYSVNTYNNPIAFYAEQDPQTFNLTSLNYDTLEFGIWNINMKNGPPLSTFKWIEPRHQTALACGTDTNCLQTQYFNGIISTNGEDSWTCYYQITPRSAEAIRRISTILRFFGAESRRLVQQLSMKPYIPIFTNTQSNYLYANEFDKDTTKEMLFLIINTENKDINNIDLVINNTFNYNDNNLHIYDCYHGEEIMNKSINNKNNEININMNNKNGIESNGYGCILITMNDTNNDNQLKSYLNTINKMTINPIKSYSNDWHYLQQNMREIPATKLYSSKPDSNSIEIPFGVFYFNVEGVEIEGDDECVDVQYSFEMNDQRYHHQYMTINKFYIDKYPVTCSDYKQYLDETNYKPSDDYNYLKNWNANNYPNGYGNKPVTYIGLDEARMYCKWKGKRLPHEYEWQYAAQGNTNYLYPWGNKANEGVNYPKTYHGRNIAGPEDVDAYSPKGDSIFGVSDLIGNVWQYTDEFYSTHIRSVVLRGSSNYYPETHSAFNINWYFPSAFQLNQHGRYFVMDNSWERAGTLGFRCAADALQSTLPLTNKTVYNWNGAGNYCVSNDSTSTVLCGSIQAPFGYNNLTEIGNIDWIQFGLNSESSNSDTWYNVRKELQINKQIITNLSINTGGGSNNNNIYKYDNNPSAFYWNDGNNINYKILTINNASRNGIYMNPAKNENTNRGFSINLSHLSGGNIYKIFIFVGVYDESAHLKVNLNINNKQYLFKDYTISGILNQSQENVCYQIIVDLSQISTNDLIKIIIEWLLKQGNDGNITIQAIAVNKLN